MLVLLVAGAASGVLTREATEMLDMLAEIEHDLGRRVTDIAAYTARFDYLMKYNAKMRAKIDYLRKKHGVVVSTIANHELMVEGPQTLPISGSLVSRLGTVVGKKRGFVMESGETAIATGIEIRDTGCESCLVKEFEVHFTNPGSKGQIKVGPFSVLVNTSTQHFKIPQPVLFKSVAVIPLSNNGNMTHYCLPEVTVQGDLDV